MGSSDHTVLATAVTTAGLADTLSADGPFTVLAPTDTAFTEALAMLGVTAEELLADTGTLTDVLKFHVISGKVGAALASIAVYLYHPCGAAADSQHV